MYNWGVFPEYPNFRKLNIKDKEAFEDFTKVLKPYVECSFVEAYAWNTLRNPTLISSLNNNLVLEMDNFLTDGYTITFLGKTKVLETIETLVTDFGEITNIQADTLRGRIKKIRNSGFLVATETNKIDYVVGIGKYLSLKGKNFEDTRRLLRKFYTYNEGVTVEKFAMSDKGIFQEIEELFYSWAKRNNNIKSFQARSSINCIETLRSKNEVFKNVKGLAMRVDNKLVGFSLNEKVEKKFAFGHFLIADNAIKGAFEALVYNVMNDLHQEGIRKINIGYDLGIENLRLTKSKLFDEVYKKYKITKRTS